MRLPLIIAAICLWPWAAFAQMMPDIVNSVQPSAGGGSVVLDANGTASTHGAIASPFTNTGLTVGTGSNRCLIVEVGLFVNTTAPTGVAATWNGTSMTLIGSANTGSAENYVFLFGLVNPASGNNTISVSWTSGNEMFTAINGTSFTGCLQTGGTSTFANFASASGTGTTASVSVTSPSGNFAIDIAGGEAGQVSSPTQTLNYNDSAQTFTGSSRTSSTNPTFSWGVVSGNWVDIGVSIVP